jgi:hypothetical protein
LIKTLTKAIKKAITRGVTNRLLTVVPTAIVAACLHRVHTYKDKTSHVGVLTPRAPARASEFGQEEAFARISHGDVYASYRL